MCLCPGTRELALGPGRQLSEPQAASIKAEVPHGMEGQAEGRLHQRPGVGKAGEQALKAAWEGPPRPGPAWASPL